MKHEAWIEWRLGAGQDVPAGRYSRAHALRFDGGAVVAAGPSPDIVPPPWTDEAGVDPEEAFAAAISACHMLWFLDLARRDGWTAAAYEDHAAGVMERNAEGEFWISRVALRPGIDWVNGPDAVAEAALHERAHHKCFIANSVTTDITIETARKDNA